MFFFIVHTLICGYWVARQTIQQYTLILWYFKSIDMKYKGLSSHNIYTSVSTTITVFDLIFKYIQCKRCALINNNNNNNKTIDSFTRMRRAKNIEKWIHENRTETWQPTKHKSIKKKMPNKKIQKIYTKIASLMNTNMKKIEEKRSEVKIGT